MKTNKGWHNQYCYMCGLPYGTIIHHGGKKELLKCNLCQDKPSVCLECFDDVL